MPLAVPCPCGQRFYVSVGLAGSHVPCPGCGREVAVPAAAPARAGTPAAVPPAEPDTAADPGEGARRVWLVGGALVLLTLVASACIIAHDQARRHADATAADLVRDDVPPPGRPTPTVPLTLPAPGAPTASRPHPASVPDGPPSPGEDEELFLSGTRLVEVVFCVDTTGSMGELLEGAKQKVWAIGNQIGNGQPRPDLRMGLVAYKDRGDDYVTHVIDLSDDLDAVGAELRKLSAGGGGDEPESVNQALDDAVHKVHWSKDAATLRMIFLVGDAAPHMDYTDDVKYPETCPEAARRGIFINAVQCGTSPDCREHWQKISRLAGGAYVQVPQTGGVVVKETPFDERLVRLNAEFARTILVYGSPRQQEEGKAKVEEAMKLSAAYGAADRVAFFARSGKAAAYDLLDAVRAGKVKLAELPREQLPAALRDLSADERQRFLGGVERRRQELRKEALDLDRKRTEFLLRADRNKAFDNQVLAVLRRQAEKFHITY